MDICTFLLSPLLSLPLTLTHSPSLFMAISSYLLHPYFHPSLSPSIHPFQLLFFYPQEKFESRFVGFWHKRLQSAEVEREIVTLETAIAEEKTNIAQLDRMLRERGETVEEEEEEAGVEVEQDSMGVKAAL